MATVAREGQDEAMGTNDLQEWLDIVAPRLGVSTEVVDAVSSAVLDRVRDVAHNVVRPGAPLTAFLVGLAAGQAVQAGAEASPADPQEVAAAVVQRLLVVDELVNAWREHGSGEAEVGLL